MKQARAHNNLVVLSGWASAQFWRAKLQANHIFVGRIEKVRLLQCGENKGETVSVPKTIPSKILSICSAVYLMIIRGHTLPTGFRQGLVTSDWMLTLLSTPMGAYFPGNLSRFRFTLFLATLFHSDRLISCTSPCSAWQPLRWSYSAWYVSSSLEEIDGRWLG